MHAQIGTVREPALRVQIVSQRQIFDDNPTEFRQEEMGMNGGTEPHAALVPQG